MEEQAIIPGMGCLAGVLKGLALLALIGIIALGAGLFVFIAVLAEVLK